MLAKIESQNDMPTFREAFDNFWDNALSMHQLWEPSFPRTPRVHVQETESNITVRAEVPGLDKRDIKVRFTDRGLEIAGDTSAAFEKETKNGYQYSHSTASFYKLVPLPNVLKNKAEAECKNGILTVKVPKAEIDKAEREYLPIK